MDDRVRVEDVYASGICIWGLEQWCRAHGFHLPTLLEEGLPADHVAAMTGDAFVKKVYRSYLRRTGQR